MWYWNSQALPELTGLNFRERMVVLRRATDQLTPPKKLALNVLKLVILIPGFLAMATAASIWHGFGYFLGLALIYPLLTRPLVFALVQPLLARARNQFEAQQ